MTATNFQDLHARASARSFYAMSGGLPDAITSDPDAGDHQLAFDILRTPVPWVDCPTCKGDREVVVTQDGMGETIHCHVQCPACAGTGKATVAQLLAWGSAIARIDPRYWPEYGSANTYRNRILGEQP